MTQREIHYTGAELELFAAANAAVAQIPPAFPLTATVAVNPYLGQAGQGRAITAEQLARVGGLRVTISREDVATKIAAGEILDDDLEVAAELHGLSVASLHDAARTEAARFAPLPTVANLAQVQTGVDWSALIEERIGLWAAGHFDEGQAFWPAPKLPAFAAWRAFAARDLTPGIAGLPDLNALATALPNDEKLAFAELCARLEVTPADAPLYFHRLLMTLGGWAQIARCKGWLAERDGGREISAFGLLTARLAWDVALLDHFGAELQAAWDNARTSYAKPLDPTPDMLLDVALQEAADRAAERRLAEALQGAPNKAAERRPTFQAAFCIDVRSEVFRRALEATDPDTDTIGFAGFFGLAVNHTAAASDTVEARAPVLLNPGVTTIDTPDADADLATRIENRATRAWGRFKMAAVSAFAFVEAAGPLYVGKLVRDANGVAKPVKPGKAPMAEGLDLPTRIATGATVLKAMSLTENFGKIVLLAGHGAHVTNAPHASALQCGACGGHAGDVNARLLASLLNDVEVREGMRAQGIDVPADTLFLAGLHDTVSDGVTLYTDDVDTSAHTQELTRLTSALARAGELARAERQARLPRAQAADTILTRGNDWSELRPEWGLAGCNAFIAAPRHRSAGDTLGGRSFLHSYDWRKDEGFGVLELILTAPVVVASWISLQYHGSAVAPEAFGAGNKLLHNVVGGIGVLEGAGGNARAGLPWQSVHDGEQLQHSPERLSVVVEAPREAISNVLDKHAGLAALFDNGWLSLHVMDDSGQITLRYERGTWQPVGGTAKRAVAA